MDHDLSEFPEVSISESLFNDIRTSVLGHLGDAGHASASADAFRDKELTRTITASVQGLVAEHLEKATTSLDDPEVGAVCVVTPDDPSGSAQHTLTRMVILIAFTATPINSLALDRLNATPFALYGASDDAKKAMQDAGLRVFAPDAVLGFHNDGALGGGRPYIPERVGLQNVVLNYGKPGQFFWLPFTLWREGEAMLKQHDGAVLRITTTPIAHQDGGTGEVVVDRQDVIETPAIWRSPDGIPTVFLNGEPLPESEALFRGIQQSLARSARRWTSDQALSRLTLIRNDRGVHARNVMDEPNAHGSTHSRMMCRTISSQGQIVPRTAV